MAGNLCCGCGAELFALARLDNFGNMACASPVDPDERLGRVEVEGGQAYPCPKCGGLNLIELVAPGGGQPCHLRVCRLVER